MGADPAVAARRPVQPVHGGFVGPIKVEEGRRGPLLLRLHGQDEGDGVVQGDCMAFDGPHLIPHVIGLAAQQGQQFLGGGVLPGKDHLPGGGVMAHGL